MEGNEVKETAPSWTLPSSPVDRKSIKDALGEIGNSLTRIAAEKDQIKAIRERLKEEFELPPKLANRLAKTMWLDSFNKEVGEQEEFRETFETLVQEAQP